MFHIRWRVISSIFNLVRWLQLHPMIFPQCSGLWWMCCTNVLRATKLPFWHPIPVSVKHPSATKSTRGRLEVQRYTSLLVIWFLDDICRICCRQGWWKTFVIQCLLLVSTSLRCVLPLGWRWHLEGVGRPREPSWSSKWRHIFNVSIVCDCTAQIGKSFNFPDALLADGYCDIWSGVSDAHDLRLGHTNSKPQSSSLTV